MTDDSGDSLYLHVGSVEIDGREAVITLSTAGARSKDSDAVYLSGGGYEACYRRNGDGWSFVEMIRMWIS